MLAFEDVVGAFLLANSRLNRFGRSKSPGSLKGTEFHEPNSQSEERSQKERNHHDASALGTPKSVKTPQTLSASEWIKPQDVKH